MLTAKETIRAIKHVRATGQRPTGHYDHSAKCSTGPVTRRASAIPSQVNYGSSEPKIKISLRSQINPETGEKTYSLTKSKS